MTPCSAHVEPAFSTLPLAWQAGLPRACDLSPERPSLLAGCACWLASQPQSKQAKQVLWVS